MDLAAQTTPLVAAIEQLGPHDHFCSIYESQAEHYAVAIPYIRIGLERGEKCIYIADDGAASELLNLILNAKDAMSEVRSHPRELIITSRKNEPGEVVIAVRDSGPGLDPKDAERISDPFFTTKAEGMGLGLSISRKIIEDQGGRMWVTANEDQGVTLQFSVLRAPGGND